MLMREDVKLGIKKLIHNYDKEFTREEVENKIKIWHERLNKWKPVRFESVVNHIIENYQRFPNLALMIKIYNELGYFESHKRGHAGFICNRCKDSGVMAFIRNDEIHAAYCDCESGIAIFRNNQDLPYIGVQVSRNDTKEYPIHTTLGPFTGHIPEGIGYKLSKEICGKDHFMYKLTEQLETGELPEMGAIRGLIKKEPDNEEELPF